jgi:hypothetical protein
VQEYNGYFSTEGCRELIRANLPCFCIHTQRIYVHVYTFVYIHKPYA